jgi:hypothetical protein
MLLVAPRTGSPSGDSYAISSEALLQIWPKVIDASNLGGVTHSDITVVQLDSRLGRATAVTTIKRHPHASFAACSRAISGLGWKLRGSADSLTLSAQTKWDWRAFAVRMDIAISRERDISKLNIDVHPVIKTTIYDFGLAKSILLRFLVALGDELESLGQ